MRLSSFVWLFFSAFLLFTGSALGQEADREHARQLFGKGVEAFELGDYAQALESFQQAYEIAPHPAVRVNLANCFEQLGRYNEAIFNYQRFLSESGASVSPAQRKEVEAAIDRLSRYFGKLSVHLIPSSASLVVDGNPIGTPSEAIKLTTGKHVVRASLDGYDDVERVVEITSDEPLSLMIELPREAPVVVQNAPVASDDELAPVMASALSPSPKPKRKRRPLLIVSGVATLALGAGWGAMAALTSSAQKDFDKQSERTADATLSTAERQDAYYAGLDAGDRADKLALTADVLMGATAAAAVTTFVLWMVGRKAEERRPSDLTLLPAVGPAMSGVALRGGF